jgi:hypothetical protein
VKKFVILIVLFLAGLWLSALAFNHVYAYVGFFLVIIDVFVCTYFLRKFINIEIKKENEKSDS